MDISVSAWVLPRYNQSNRLLALAQSLARDQASVSCASANYFVSCSGKWRLRNSRFGCLLSAAVGIRFRVFPPLSGLPRMRRLHHSVCRHTPDNDGCGGCGDCFGPFYSDGERMGACRQRSRGLSRSAKGTGARSGRGSRRSQDAEAARLEVSRRLLSVTRQAKTPLKQPDLKSRSGARAFALAAALIAVPALSAAMYVRLSLPRPTWRSPKQTLPIPGPASRRLSSEWSRRSKLICSAIQLRPRMGGSGTGLC